MLRPPPLGSLLGRLPLPRRIRLAALLAAIVSGLVLLAAGSMLAAQWLVARRVAVEFLNESVKATVEELERGVHRRLDPVADLLDDLAALVADGRLDLADPAGLEGALAAALAGRPELGAVGLVRPDRSRTFAARVPEGRVEITTLGADRPLPPELALDLDLDLDLDSTRGAAPDAPRWGGVVYVPAQRQPALYVLRPVRGAGPAGPPLGHLAAGVTIGQLSTLVDALAEEGPETPFVLAGGDAVLAHPQLVDLGDRLWPAKALPGRGEVNDPVVAALGTGRHVADFDRVRRFGIDVTLVPAAGDGTAPAALVATKEVPGYGEGPWTLGLWIPAEVLSDALAPLRWGVAVGLGLLLLALATSVLVGRRLARPVREITAGASTIASLEFNDARPLPRSRVREFDKQAKAFNGMLATLRAFATYVPRSVVTRLIQNGGADAIPSVQRDLTVMFTDVQGFTLAAERWPAADIAAMLNEHFALLARCVEAEGGTVDKYLGDGMMAFWGAPDRLKDRAARACRAALAIRTALEAGNEWRRTQGFVPIRVRIGLHRGRLVVGNIGAPGRVNYTVVGDVVNVAQRLEQFGREVMGEGDSAVIVASDAVVDHAGPGFAFERLGEAEMRGRREPIEAFRLLGRAAAPAPAPAAPAPAEAAEAVAS